MGAYEADHAQDRRISGASEQLGASADDGGAAAAAATAAAAGEQPAWKPFGYGAVFPSFSPRSSGAGDTNFDWTMAEEKILRDVAAWLSPADLRRARLVCKAWCGALATLVTRATTPPEETVSQWRCQLEALVHAFPCLHELTVGSRVSSMAAQQLGVLAGAQQLRVLNLPHAQALQDRSLLALQPLAPRLRQLRVHGAASLSKRALLLLSVLASLEALELRNCGKISWAELQHAWKSVCAAYGAQAAAEAAAQQPPNAPSSSGGGSAGSAGPANGPSSSGGGSSSSFSRLGSWLPTGRLFRTSSPTSTSIQSALVSQRSGASALFGRMQELARGTSGAAAVAAAQVGIGAVGNGRSSCGGGVQEGGAARSLLHRKQKLGAAASFTAYESATGRLAASARACSSSDGTGTCGGAHGQSGCLPLPGSPILRLRARSEVPLKPAAADHQGSPRPASMLSRVGSLVWHTSAAHAAAASGDSVSSLGLDVGSSSSLAVQTSSVQAALQAYLDEEDRAAAELEGASAPARPLAAASSSGGRHTEHSSAAAPACAQAGTSGGSQPSAAAREPGLHSASSSLAPASAGIGQAASASPSSAMSSAAADATAAAAAAAAAAAPTSAGGRAAPGAYRPRRRTTGDKALPAMPLTKLRSLTFSCSAVTLKSPEAELAALAAISSLTALEISKCKLPDAAFGQLRGLRRLAKLRLTGLWSMGDAGLAELATLTSLQSLALAEAMHATAQGLQQLAQLTGLTSLAVGLTQDVGQGALARVVVALPLLQFLEVAGPSWGDLDCELLAEHAAAVAAAQGVPPRPASPNPQMLWDVAAMAGSAVPTTSAAAENAPAGSGGGGASRVGSSRQLLAGLLAHGGGSTSSRMSSRSSSSMNLQRSSFSSLRTASFGSFAVPGLSVALHTQHTSGGGSCCSGGGSRSMSASQRRACQQLLVLRLHGSRGLTARGLAALRQLPGLHTLLLDGCREVPAAEFISQGVLPPKLASLGLRGLPFGNLFAGCVTAPACGTHLTHLELSGLQGVHDGQLRRLLGFFPRVAHLSLAGCVDFGDAALIHLPMLGRLAHLNLGGTAVTGATFDHLCRLSELRVLELRGCCQLGDAGLEHLLRAPALEVLDVAECGGLSGGALVATLAALPRLVRLDVCGCKSVGAGLLAARPHYVTLQHSLQ